MPEPEVIDVETGPPSLRLFAAEGQRALLESLTLPVAAGLLASTPRGDGHSVLVLPGFTASDRSTQVLRGYLRSRGYWAHGWRMGSNVGMDPKLRGRLADRVHELHHRSGRPISLVGWSLGGIYAREIAKRLPERVRQVVTLGSPFANAGRATNVSRLFDWFQGPKARTRQAFAERLRVPPPVPSSAIYSKTDGVAHWHACREPEAPQTENIEVPGSHCGLGSNPLVLYAVADRLSQPAGSWQPFARGGWRRHVYG